MSLKELLERKKKLLETIRSEEVARKELVECLNSILEGAKQSNDGMLKQGPGPTAVQGVKSVLEDILKKKAGAAAYEREMYSLCQKASAALEDAMEGSKAANGDGLAAQKQPAAQESSEAVAAKDESVNGTASPANVEGSDRSTSITKTEKKTVPIKPAALGLMKFGQLVAVLRENDEADDTDNLAVILDRLAMLQRITKEQIKEHSAGKLVGKLSKHRIWEVSTRASKVVAHWKALLEKGSGASSSEKKRSITPPLSKHPSKDKTNTSKERDREKGREKERTKDKRSPVNSSSNLSSKEKDRRASSQPARKSSSVGTKRPLESSKRPESRSKEGPKPLPSKKKSAMDKYADSESEDDFSQMDFKAWEAKYQKKLSRSYDNYAMEEDFSRKVADYEDEMALLEEQRANKKRKG